MILWLAFILMQDAGTRQEQASAAMREKRYAEAVRIYREMARENPAWRLNLGMALVYAEQHREAAEELAAVIARDPKPGAAHVFLGVARLKLNQPCEAIAPLETSLQWAERPVTRWKELADAYQGCRRWPDAARAYQEAAKTNRDEAWRLERQAAHCWRMAHRYDLARQLFASLDARYAGNAEFEFEYGDTLARLDGAAAGLARLERAVRKDAALTPARGALGRALLELSRPAEAIPHLEAASASDAAALVALGRAYRAVGRVSDASRVEAEYRQRILRER